MAYIWPVPSGTRITQPFGSSPNNGFNPIDGHTGTDFGVPTGTPIRAISTGVVKFASWATDLPADYRADGSGPNPYWINPNFAGICVIIDHGPVVTVNAHLSKTDLNVGNTVKQGDIIGYSGMTGAASGPHLHFETLPNGWNFRNGTYGRVNPAIFCAGYWNPHPVVPAPSKAIAANQRETSVVTNKRATPSTTGKLLESFKSGLVLTFKGFVHGESVSGNNVWFVGISGAYIWSGCFADSSTRGLSDLTPKPAPAPAPKPVPKPVPAPVTKPVPTPAPAPQPAIAPYSFTPDFDFVEYHPADINNVERASDTPTKVVFPAKPEKAVIHQFGTVGVDTIGSTLNQFSNPNLGAKAVSAHFVVSGKRIVQVVSLKDRAYHAYSIGNNWVGIETDPAQDADTIASVNKLLRALKAKYGYTLTPIRHKEVPLPTGGLCMTNCGTLVNLNNYQIDAVPVVPAPTPAPVTPTPASPAGSQTPEQVIADFQAWQRDLYLKQL